MGNVVFNHDMHQQRFNSTTTNLSQLRELHAQNSIYNTNFQLMDVERQTNLAEQEHLNKRVEDLIAKLDRVNKELAI